MFEDWKEQRKAIKVHILKMYNGTNDENYKELDKFLDFVIDNYDLDDNLFEQVKEDLEFKEDDDVMDIVTLEEEEYGYNILNRRCL